MMHKYADAGFDHLYFHQVGPDQDGFLRFFEHELRPAFSDSGRGLAASDGVQPQRASR